MEIGALIADAMERVGECVRWRIMNCSPLSFFVLQCPQLCVLITNTHDTGKEGVITVQDGKTLSNEVG